MSSETHEKIASMATELLLAADGDRIAAEYVLRYCMASCGWEAEMMNKGASSYIDDAGRALAGFPTVGGNAPDDNARGMVKEDLDFIKTCRHCFWGLQDGETMIPGGVDCVREPQKQHKRGHDYCRPYEGHKRRRVDG